MTITESAQGIDRHGNPTSGPTAAIERHDAAVDRLVRFHPDVVDQAFGLMSDEPEFAMGQVMGGYLALTSTDAPDVDSARDALAKLADVPMNARERAHTDVIAAWTAGDWVSASRGLDDLLIRWPADLLALMVGHQLDFFLGDAQNLRDRVGRSLHAFDPADPHHAFVKGMQSFGLEEAGHYGEAEAAGIEAVERNRDDVWAIHAVVHTYEMQGRIDEGIRFLQSRQDDWGDNNLFMVHNWWHLAVYLLEAGLIDQVLGIYDERIHNEGSDGVPLEMIDASALLWRLELDGIDTGGRFGPLADAWATRTEAEPWYGFNDLHAVMALAGAGRLADARAVIDRLARYVRRDASSSVTNVAMTAEVALPASQAALAFVEGRHDAVVDTLLPIRRVFQRFGGSHAQRDALQRTLLESAIRSGRLDLARALVSERLSLRESSVYGWEQLAAIARAQGNQSLAGASTATAAAGRARFAGAAA
jgi:tetratricopeptide (TPR) repeat protein